MRVVVLPGSISSRIVSFIEEPSGRESLMTWLTGVRRNARVRPLCTPQPTICPALLIALAFPKEVHPAATTTGSALKSTITPFDHRKARRSLTPTTCPMLLIALATLLFAPGNVPRSCIPVALDHRNAWLLKAPKEQHKSCPN